MKALALKYRPKSFDELIGQDVVASSLSHALDSGRLSHAYLFSGLRGSGKTSSARIFAKALLCEQGISSHPCEVCANCVMANEGRHLDIIEMDAASHRKIDDVRELIEHTKYSPSSARFKIFIIDEVHMLTKEAFNALLKTLEEPPEYIKFILATTDPLRLPATILSRTQHFRFRPISKSNIIKHLEFILNKEGIKYEPKALEILSRSGSGSLRDTLTLLDQAIIFSHEFVTQKSVADMLGLLDPQKIEEIIEVVASRDKNALLNLLKELSGSDAELIIDELIMSLKDKFINQNSKFSMLIFERFFRILSETKNMLGLGSDPEFALYLTLFMMLEAFNLTNIDDAIKELKQGKQELMQTSIATEQIPIIKKEQTPYQSFLNQIYDRDFDLGNCFDECVKFIEFKDNILVLSSNASGKNQEILRESSSTIKEILRRCFGNDAKIEIKKAEPKQTAAVQKLLENVLPQTTEKKPQVEPSQDRQSKPDEAVFAKKDERSLNSIALEKKDEDPMLAQLKSNTKELTRLFGEPEILKDSD